MTLLMTRGVSRSAQACQVCRMKPRISLNLNSDKDTTPLQPLFQNYLVCQ